MSRKGFIFPFSTRNEDAWHLPRGMMRYSVVMIGPDNNVPRIKAVFSVPRSGNGEHQLTILLDKSELLEAKEIIENAIVDLDRANK